MPKSTGPLMEQLGMGTENQSTPKSTYPDSTGMTDSTTAAADKLGANKSTNAIPQDNPSMLSSAGAIGKNCMLHIPLTSSHLKYPIFKLIWY